MRQPNVCQYLIANYRSHPALVKILSRVSYANKLVPRAEADKVNCLAHWEKRGTKKSYPLLFCGLEGGTEEQEGDSPSVFNRQEASTLLVLIQDLLQQMVGSTPQTPLATNPRHEPSPQTPLATNPSGHKPSPQPHAPPPRPKPTRSKTPEDAHSARARLLLPPTLRGIPRLPLTSNLS